MLLHYCTLTPNADSDLAAIRFNIPVWIKFIRIFPTGVQPFAKNPELVASTVPAAFYLDVYFNVLPVNPPNIEHRVKASNVLANTMIAYTGSQPTDFAVNMGPESSTKLMIIKGAFEQVSLAVYGELVSELPPPPTTYEPSPLPVTESLPISSALDPCNSQDPANLALQLLAMNPNSPPLPLVVRLMLCLKAPEEDWDLPNFPLLFYDPEREEGEGDLQRIYLGLSRPVSDELGVEPLGNLASKVAVLINEKDRDGAHWIAGILARAASQNPLLARSLLEHLDLESLFDEDSLDFDTITRLTDACANADISCHLSAQWFTCLLRDIQKSPAVEKKTQSAARKLGERIQGWQTFENALSNPQVDSDFAGAIEFLKAVGSEEASCGIWLTCMLTHEGLKAKHLHDGTKPPKSNLMLFTIFRMGNRAWEDLGYNEFLAFVRAFVGVACVLVVWCWSDSVPYDRCRERTTGILRLWQGVPGYREILNHLLLLRQMSFRLECMTDNNDPPTRSGSHAEHLVLDLAQDPQSVLKPDLILCILSLKQPLSLITEDERLSLRKAALVADDGLPGAIEELKFESNHPMSLRRIRVIRVAIAIVYRELTGKQTEEWAILEELWKEKAHGLLPRLVNIFVGIGNDLRGHFALHAPLTEGYKHVRALLLLVEELLPVIAKLVPNYPVASRVTRALADAIAGVYVCASRALSQYSRTPSISFLAGRAREACVDTLRIHSRSRAADEQPNLELVLKTLFECALHGDEVDPNHTLAKTYELVMKLLPPAGGDEWVDVLPNVLLELTAVFQALEGASKKEFAVRLIELDKGVVGIGEWLLQDDLKNLSRALRLLDLDSPPSEDRYQIVHVQVLSSLRLLLGLLLFSSAISDWCVGAFNSVPGIAESLAGSLLIILDHQLWDETLLSIAFALTARLEELENGLCFALILVLLRKAYILPEMVRRLKRLPEEYVYQKRFRLWLGKALAALAFSEREIVDAGAIFPTLEWLVERNLSVFDVTKEMIGGLIDRVLPSLAEAEKAKAESLKSKIKVEADESVSSLTSEPSYVTYPLSPQVKLSLRSLSELLKAPPYHSPAHDFPHLCQAGIPSTPTKRKGGMDTPEVIGMVAVSPPIALLRSPAATGLTKTYARNEFRQMRQAPSTRQNTSRLPSMHVDEFEMGDPASSPTLPASTIPMADVFRSAPNPQLNM